MGSDWREHTNEARARIWCTADDLNLFGRAVRAVRPCFDPAKTQAIGIGMLLCLDHAADAEGTQRFGWVFNLFDLKPRSVSAAAISSTPASVSR